MYSSVRQQLIDAFVATEDTLQDGEYLSAITFAKALSGVEHFKYQRYGVEQDAYLYNLADIPHNILSELMVCNGSYELIGIDERKELLLHMLKNRTKFIAAIASSVMLNDKSEYATYLGSRSLGILTITTRYATKDRVALMRRELTDWPKIGKQYLRTATLYYNTTVNKLTEMLNKISPVPKTGLINVLSSRAATELDYDTAYEQIQEIVDNMPNNLTARTWGWELEVADAKEVRLNVRGLEAGRDGSIRSDNTEDCECSCRECNYHDCNCDNCEDQNDDPEHCNDRDYCVKCDSVEFKSTNGIQRTHNPGLKQLIDKLNEEEAEMNDSCGIHIHVYGQDLTPKQVGGVMAAYKLLKPLFNELMMRNDTEYSRNNPVFEMQALFKGNAVFQKMRDVNVCHLQSGARGTIEFRQAEGRLDYTFIVGWAYILRSLVTSFKRGAQVNDFFDVRSITELVDRFKKFNTTPLSESPEEYVYGTLNDASYIKTHRFVGA